ncbi:beta-1,4-galactosyltransferase 4 isoform X2 [Daphnia magna]|uniref:beta-1,4-galactosyltransferase 4 isoform X2 n=1 Tax=Daphnia magna TaxID=35525 RepID=UPI001402D732|nr:beta-1,4-galactosyltransferase 4 isoform X2 [Daphnia magna]
MTIRCTSMIVRGVHVNFLISAMFCVSFFSFMVTHFFGLPHISQHRIVLKSENIVLPAIQQHYRLSQKLGISSGGKKSSTHGIRDYIPIASIFAKIIVGSTTIDSKNKIKGLCPFVSPLLVGWTNMSMIASDSRKENEYAFTSRMSTMGLKPGGNYKPENCYSRNKVALIVPYRRREFHLKIFLRYMHPFLQRQQLQYVIFIVEQTNGSPFNRGMLMNIGYQEALKLGSFQCFIFHDVDLLPEDDRNPYTCPKNERPRQMAYSIDIYDYRQTPKQHLGGVSAFTVNDFQLINGFSNLFWGWGSEDDDLFRRVLHHNLTVIRITDDEPSFGNIVRYRMIDHRKEKSNPDRDLLLDGWKYRLINDGLSNLSYIKLHVQLTPLFTHVLADIQQTPLTSG